MLKPALTNQPYLATLLQRHHVQPARSAGQNFLICDEVIEAITTITDAGPVNVTELGAGVGPVTIALLGQGKRVRAIERDQTLAKILRAHVPRQQTKQVSLMVTDLKTADWSWPTTYQIVGNIPYNLSGLIIRQLSQLDPAPAQTILLVQQEVGQRLAAAPPDFHLISLATQLWANATMLVSVPATCFWPAPKVTSQLILLTPRSPRLPLPQREAILALAKPLFQQRRKQLKGTLAHTQQISGNQAAALLATCGIAPTARPQEVTIDQWQQLYEALRSKK